MLEKLFDNSSVRRQDRLLDFDRVKELIESAEYGVMSMTDDNGEAYGVPINFVWDGETALYAHCAISGKKLRSIVANPLISFCIVGRTQPIPEKFTTLYESVVIRGRASTWLSEEEKWKALRLLVKKFSPSEVSVCDEKIAKSLPRTEIIRIDIMELSGKAKK